MSSRVYQKVGTAIRSEWLGDLHVTHEINERGHAEEGSGWFSARSGEAALQKPDAPARVKISFDNAFGSVSLQTLVIVAGSVRHSYRDDLLAREWQEQTVRSHVSATLRPLELPVALEAALDLDGDQAWDVELRDLDRVLRAPRVKTPFTLSHVVTEPRACAQLIELLAPSRTLQLRQHGAGLVDGDGAPIASVAIDATCAPPNRARPSYRHPPRRVWMHSCLEPLREPAALWRAPLVLWSGWSGRDELHADLLLTSGDAWTVVRASGPAREWSSAIEAVSAPRRWYPSPPSGVWGSTVTLDLQRLSRR